MDNIIVDARVHKKHPEIEDTDVFSAWKNTINVVLRETSEKDFLIAVGSDMKGRLLEMVATEEDDGTKHIFHAMTPPSEKTLRETGFIK